MNILSFLNVFLLTTYTVAMDSSSPPFPGNTADLLMEVDGLVKVKKTPHEIPYKKLEFCILAFCEKAYTTPQELDGDFVQRFDELEELLLKKKFGKTDPKEKELLGIFQNSLGISHYTLGKEFFTFDDSNNISEEFLKSATAFKNALANGYDPSIEKNVDEALSHYIRCGYISYYGPGQYEEASQIFKKAAELGSINALVCYADAKLERDKEDLQTAPKYRQKRLDNVYDFLIKAYERGYANIGKDEHEKEEKKKKLLDTTLSYAKARLKLDTQSQERLDEVYDFLIKVDQSGYENIGKDEDEKAERKHTLAETMTNLAYGYADLEKNGTKEEKFKSPNRHKILSLCDMSIEKGDLPSLVNYAQFLLEYDFDREESTGFQKCQDLLKKAQAEGYAECDSESIEHFARVNKNVNDCLALYKKKKKTEESKRKRDLFKEKLMDTIQDGYVDVDVSRIATLLKKEEKKIPQPSVKKAPCLQDFLATATKQIGFKDYPGAILAYEKGLAVFPNNPEIYGKLLDLYDTYKESLKAPSLEKMRVFCREVLDKCEDQEKALSCLVWDFERNGQYKEILDLISSYPHLPSSLLISLYQSQKALGLPETYTTLNKAFETMSGIVSWRPYSDWIYQKFSEQRAFDLLNALDCKDPTIKVDQFEVDLKGFKSATFYETLLLQSMEDFKNLMALRCCEKTGLFLLGEFLKTEQEMGLSKISFETYQKHLKTLKGYEPLKNSSFLIRHLPYLAQQAKLHIGTMESILFGEEWIEQGGQNDHKIIKNLVNFYFEKLQENNLEEDWISKIETLRNSSEDSDWIEVKLENYELRKQIEGLNQKNKDQETQIKDLHDSCRNQSNILKAQGEKLKSEKEEKDQAAEKIKELEGNISILTHQLTQKTQDLMALEQKNNPKQEKEILDLKTDLWSKRNRIQQLEEALVSTVDGKFTLRERAQYLSPKLQQLNGIIFHLYQTIYNLEEQLLEERDFWRGRLGENSKNQVSQ